MIILSWIALELNANKYATFYGAVYATGPHTGS